jgi:glucose-6-phosphate 1-epimerase
MSKNSFFDFGKPVRGGIPVCWPWFGAYPDGGEDKPPHGFARKMMWQVKDTGILEDGSSRLLLELEASGETLGMWNHDFRLNIEFIAGSSMKVALRTENTGISPFEITQALHSYFSVGDISQIEIEGFADSEYIDALKPDGWNRGRVSGSVVFDKETDLIFPDNGNSYTIRDFSMKRKIHISKSGSNSAVVWNPWIDKSARMPDFGDNEYRDMVCVEVTNTSADKRIISPGEKHTLSTELSCETL